MAAAEPSALRRSRPFSGWSSGNQTNVRGADSSEQVAQKVPQKALGRDESTPNLIDTAPNMFVHGYSWPDIGQLWPDFGQQIGKGGGTKIMSEHVLNNMVWRADRNHTRTATVRAEAVD